MDTPPEAAATAAPSTWLGGRGATIVGQRYCEHGNYLIHFGCVAKRDNASATS